MFDIEIFRYELQESSIRLTQVKSFVASEPVALGERQIDVTLGLERVGLDWAFTKAFDFLGRRLPCRRRTGLRRDRGLILTDDAGIAAIEGLTPPALMLLASLTTGSFDRQYLHGRDEAGGFPIEIDVSNGRMLGYLSSTGMLDVLRVDPVVSFSREAAWVMSALRIFSEHHAPAPESMRALLLAPDPSAMEGSWKLLSAFWCEAVPAMKDPLVRQRRLILGQSGEELDMYAQPAPTLTFRTGSAAELVDLLDSYFILKMAGKDGEPYRDAMASDDSFDVCFHARFGEEPLSFVGTSVRRDRDADPIVALILDIMQPEGSMLDGGPRLSEAKAAPAIVVCEISAIRYGFPDGGPADDVASSHELIEHARKLSAFLERHGVTNAAHLVDTI